MPEDWRAGWRRRRLATHLSTIDSQQEFRRLAAARQDLEHDLARLYHDAVVRRTWLKLAESATPRVRAALQAYLNAIQKIGKGTGKRAARYRQDAREAAAEANTAVPCWIMPHHRVSESLPPQFGCFDLVVIDEASQSDLSALPALLRGRKLLIVGDDKQVSPEGVGQEEQKIKATMQRYLGEQVALYRAQMSPERSIYDLAKVVFAGSGVMLKEHFRCVAPIIEYSKREFYAHELRPLRLPRPSERIDPPLVDVWIQNAERKDDVNAAEADYIVGEIRRIAADPRMQHRSIGVVSLLGESQALHIWERLVENLSPEILHRHAIACGDARTFQGRERDIMFLSMVSAPNAVGAPLSRDIFAQRFNVAASRARDRMVLVRSVDLDDLSEADRLRRGLIAHFSAPFAEHADPSGDPRDRCESPMERELYDWLAQRGYRVTPQARIGRLSHRSARRRRQRRAARRRMRRRPVRRAGALGGRHPPPARARADGLGVLALLRRVAGAAAGGRPRRPGGDPGCPGHSPRDHGRDTARHPRRGATGAGQDGGAGGSCRRAGAERGLASVPFGNKHQRSPRRVSRVAREFPVRPGRGCARPSAARAGRPSCRPPRWPRRRPSSPP